jgi:hypothetical protein
MRYGVNTRFADWQELCHDFRITGTWNEKSANLEAKVSDIFSDMKIMIRQNAAYFVLARSWNTNVHGGNAEKRKTKCITTRKIKGVTP